jgi:glyceraldehyde 3-phosphate dehydrogenase
MSKVKVGVNGFGRIGRALVRICHNHPDFEIVAINTKSSDPKMLAYLLKHDSLYRTFDQKVDYGDGFIAINDRKIICTACTKPGEIPWSDSGVEIVVDATGAFTLAQDLESHIRGTVKKVVLTCPAKDKEILDFVIGVNIPVIGVNNNLRNSSIISNASCTTNCVTPMLKVLDDAFGVHSGFLTTTHAYTATQSLLDEANKEPNRSRAAALSIIPTTTGAAKAVSSVMPHLKGKIDGMALRVPVPVVSFIDLTVAIDQPTTIEDVNELFKVASVGEMAGIMGYSTEELVSCDFIGNTNSCIFDANYTKIFGLEQNNIRVFGWYDNEWGYANRVADLVKKCCEVIKN